LKLFLLGAGKPAHGDKPSALKLISTSTTVLDWKIHSFESIVSLEDIYFLGGYHIDEVIQSYPKLNFSVIPEWKNKNILETFFSAPFSNSNTVISYSDTIFRKSIIQEMLSMEADVIFGIDSFWKKRYTSRELEDINNAETILVNGQKVEFTGLIYFSKKVIEKISRLNASDIGTSLIDLIKFLEKNDFSIKTLDVKGEWAEFNSPDDISKFILGTKAETLARLEPLVKKSHIGKQVSFCFTNWIDDSNAVIKQILETFKNKNLVVRSSSKSEDNWDSSNAGKFESILNVDILNQNEVVSAINTVIASYGKTNTGDDQVLVQEFIKNVSMSGVIFTCGLETGSPYYRINFDDVTQSTESVTAGTHGDLRTIIVSKLDTSDLDKLAPELMPVLEAVKELELLLGFDKLDIEFAIDNNGLVHIFQVRPISVSHSEYDLNIKMIEASITNAKSCFVAQQKLSPFLYGSSTILANMPDWNPAEIIGIRPKPLAFSLYRQIITNDIWAQQRAEFGYCDIRPYPLIVALAGQPYVDTRASFNSFIPIDISSNLKSKLANTYIDILRNNPQLHDKIEFDVAYTIWTPNFINNARNRFSSYNFQEDELAELEISLKSITNKALIRLHTDISSIHHLEERRNKVLLSDLSSLDQAFILLDDCRKFGTLAFSHAARAGFVATTFLNSLVNNNLLTEDRKHEFSMSFNTVAGDFEEAKYLYSIGDISLEELTYMYGHLRPGTYELKAQAYWEDPQQYLIPENVKKPKEIKRFVLTKTEKMNLKKILDELSSNLSPEEFLTYFKEAIQARESVKFEFTKNLSKALDLIIKAGLEVGIKRSKLSYLEYSDLEQLKLNILSLKDIKKNIKRRKKIFKITQSIELPSLIKDTSEFHCFERSSSEPNFVTIKTVESPIYLFNTDDKIDMSGKIVMIPQADPGYDWLFSHSIAGLITQYGGANSHMAIRAAEIGLPSAIGVGQKLYEKISLMKRIELNCSSKIIREIT